MSPKLKGSDQNLFREEKNSKLQSSTSNSKTKNGFQREKVKFMIPSKVHNQFKSKTKQRNHFIVASDNKQSFKKSTLNQPVITEILQQE